MNNNSTNTESNQQQSFDLQKLLGPNKSNKEKFFQRKYIYISLTLFLGIALSILFFFVIFNAKDVNISIGKIAGALKPFIYGGIIAYILVPMCNFFERWTYLFMTQICNLKKETSKKISEILGIVLSFIVAILIIYVLLSLIIPQLIVSLTVISGNLSGYYSTVVEFVRSTFKDNEPLLAYIEEFTGSISETFSNWLKTDIIPSAKTLVSNLSSGILGAVSVVKNMFIGLIVAVYLLKSRQTFAAQSKIFLHCIMKEKHADRLIKEVRFTNKMFMGFISGRLLDSAIIGVLCCIGLTILDMPYAFLISVIVGVTNVIPFFGPFIGGIPSALLILMVDPVKCIWFIIFIIILQQLDGNIIGPKIMGEMTNLNSFWVLFALMLFSGLFGFVGMIIGVPVFAVIYHLSQELILRGMKRTGYIPSPEEAETSKLNEFLENRYKEETTNESDRMKKNNTTVFIDKLLNRIHAKKK
ncbi:MAG: AI-2E family transporter [Lachnospiraceae bacterium]|nr:AI-2E family transporter [Lachnospiraceae bacterium]